MKKMIYINGKMSGDQGYIDKFLNEEIRLVKLGYYAVNPAKIASNPLGWYDAMRLVLREMLLCDGVSLLPDWQDSKGAQIEERLARELGIEVRPNTEWT
jgi:hypothetical protein